MITPKILRAGSRAAVAAVPLGVILLVIGVASVRPGAQSFDSGSDGSDGALTITANSG